MIEKRGVAPGEDEQAEELAGDQPAKAAADAPPRRDKGGVSCGEDALSKAAEEVAKLPASAPRRTPG